jgi:hypothetical protein
MLEQLGKKHEALPLAQARRQHVGRQRFLDDGHRAGQKPVGEVGNLAAAA